MSWTPELKAQLKALAEKGLSAAQIAFELRNNFSRNAIIGAAHRSGISLSRSNVGGRKPGRRIIRSVKKVRLFDGLPLPPPKPKRPYGGQCYIEQVRGCRYPFGERNFLFCNANPEDNSPYCPEHAAICYNRTP